MAKLYLSQAWLTREFLVKRKTAQQIADEQKVSVVTIRSYLHKFGLMK